MSNMIIFATVNIAVVPLAIASALLLVAAFRIDKPTIPPAVEQLHDYLERRDRK